MPRSDYVQVTAYLTPETVGKLELLAEILAPGEALSKQTALRIALARGLEILLPSQNAKKNRPSDK